jgi:Na+/H+-translocating membrane pyrophosphatase
MFGHRTSKIDWDGVIAGIGLIIMALAVGFILWSNDAMNGIWGWAFILVWSILGILMILVGVDAWGVYNDNALSLSRSVRRKRDSLKHSRID